MGILAVNFDKSRAIIAVRKGRASWWIDGRQYGNDKPKEHALWHFEALLGWKHPVCNDVSRFLRAA